MLEEGCIMIVHNAINDQPERQAGWLESQEVKK